MAIKVKAVERKLKFTKNENDPGVYRYVLGAELYTALNQKKVIREAALRSGVSQGVMQACWDAAGEVEDTEQAPSSDIGSNTSGTGSNTGGSTQGGDNTGGGSTGGDDYHDPDGGTNSDE